MKRDVFLSLSGEVCGGDRAHRVLRRPPGVSATGGSPRRRAWLTALVALSVLCGSAFAQTSEPRTEANPRNAETFSSAWLWREAVWATDTGREEAWGGRLIAQLGIGPVGLTIRADVGGLPENFNFEDPTTFQSASGFLAAHYNAYAKAGAVVGPTVFVGRAISLEDGQISKAPVPGGYTGGVGLRIGAVNAAGYVAIGTHEALGGLCVLGTAHVPLTTRLAVVVDGASSKDGKAYVRIGMAVILAASR